MPEFSIIVPVYNVEDYLPRCINSIINQTYTDFELILVDDGSTDDCSMICDEYAEKDNRIKVIHKENGGVATARNIGIESATGRYITFCDSDDYYKKELLETVYSNLKENDVDLLSYNYDVLHSTGIKRGSNVDIGIYSIFSPKDTFSLIIKHTFTSFLGWSMCTSFIRAELIHNNDLRVCTSCNNYAEDIGFGLKVLFHTKKVVGIPDSLYVYDRTREQSMMNQSKMIFKCNEVNEVAFDIWQEFSKTLDDSYYPYYSVIFFQLMYGEYVEMIWKQKIRSLPDEIKKIQRKEWYITQTKQVLKNKKIFLDFYDKKQVREYLAMCRYCLSGSYNKYHLDCWINNKINSK